MPKNNVPVHRLRSGALSVSVWEQKGTKGQFYTVNAQRAYTQDDGKTWEHTDSFSRDDLPVIGSLLLQAHAWIVRKEGQGNERTRE